MKTTITESFECKYSYILNKLNKRCYDSVTQQDIADSFHVSRKKINSFINGKNIDIELLSQYANLCGMELKFELFELDLFNIQTD